MNPRIAITGCDATRRTLAEWIDEVRSLGAEGIELDVGHLPLLSAPLDVVCDEAITLIHEAGLTAVGLNLPDLAASREDELPAVVDQLNQAIALAGQLNIRGVSLAVGPRSAMSIESADRCLARLLAVAETAGVRVRLCNRIGSRCEQIEDLRRLVADLHHPLLGLRIDAGAFDAAAVNPRDVFAEFSELTDAIVCSDRIGRRDVPPGAGRVNLPGLVADARRASYDEWFVVHAEQSNPDGLSPPKNPVELVRRLWSDAREQHSS